MKHCPSLYQLLLASSRDEPYSEDPAALFQPAAESWAEIRRMVLEGDTQRGADLDICRELLGCAETVDVARQQTIDILEALSAADSVPRLAAVFDGMSHLEERHLFKAGLLTALRSTRFTEENEGETGSPAPEQTAQEFLKRFTPRFCLPVSVPIDAETETELIPRLAASTWCRLAELTVESAARQVLAQKVYGESGQWENLLKFELTQETADALVGRFDVWMLETILSEFSSTPFGDLAFTRVILALAREGQLEDADTLLSKFGEDAMDDESWLELSQCACTQTDYDRASKYAGNIASPVLSATARAFRIEFQAGRCQVRVSLVDELLHLLSAVPENDRSLAAQSDSAFENIAEGGRKVGNLSRLLDDALVGVSIGLGQAEEFEASIRALKAIRDARKRSSALTYFCWALEDASYMALNNGLPGQMLAVSEGFRNSDFFQPSVETILRCLARMDAAEFHGKALEIARQNDDSGRGGDGCRFQDLVHAERVIAEAAVQNWDAVHGLLTGIQNPERRVKSAGDAAVHAMQYADWGQAALLLETFGETGMPVQEMLLALERIEALDDPPDDLLYAEFLSAVKTAEACCLSSDSKHAVTALVHRLFAFPAFDGRLDVLKAALLIVSERAWSAVGIRQVADFQSLVMRSLHSEEAEELAPIFAAIQRDGDWKLKAGTETQTSGDSEEAAHGAGAWSGKLLKPSDFFPEQGHVFSRWLDAACKFYAKNTKARCLFPELLAAVDLIREENYKAFAVNSAADLIEERAGSEEALDWSRLLDSWVASSGALESRTAFSRSRAREAATRAIEDLFAREKLDGDEVNPLRSGAPPLQSAASGAVNENDFDRDLEEVEAMEPGWGRVERARKLAQRSLMLGGGVFSVSAAGFRGAAFELAMSSITDLLRSIAAKGQWSDLLMDEVSDLADILALTGDAAFAAPRLESLLYETLKFSNKYRDCGAGRIGVAYAKIGDAAKAFEIVDALTLPATRCESFGAIAAELAGAGHPMDERAAKLFEEDTRSVISLNPRAHMLGNSICRVMNAFAEKRNLEGVQMALSLYMGFLSTGCGAFELRCELLMVLSSLEKSGILSHFEPFLKELICAGLINARQIKEMLIWGFPSRCSKHDGIVLRSVVRLIPYLSPCEQPLVLQECVQTLARRPEEEDRVIDYICDVATSEGTFDFLCSERFWRELEGKAPDERRRIVRRAAALCPIRKDVALWTVTEMVSIELRDGNWDGAMKAAKLLGEEELVVFLGSLNGAFPPLRHCV